MKFIPRLLPAFIFLYFLAAPIPGTAGDLAFQGTHILAYSTMGRLAEAYKKREGVTIPVMGGGCSDGVVAVTRGRASMGGLCCPLKPEETKLGLVAHPVAKDIKVAIVNFINPLKSLSPAQLRAIHQGRITNWKELGWIDRPIAVVLRKHCPDRREPVRTFLGLDPELKKLAPKAIVVNTDIQVIDYVKRFPTAIGTTSDVFVKNRSREVRRLALDGVPPGVAAVEAGKYSFAETLYIVTNGQPDQETGKFLAFARSPEGLKIIREHLAAP